MIAQSKRLFLFTFPDLSRGLMVGSKLEAVQI